MYYCAMFGRVKIYEIAIRSNRLEYKLGSLFYYNLFWYGESRGILYSIQIIHTPRLDSY